MRKRVHIQAVSIILVRPKFPENIGAVARMMKNMGFNRLMIVNGCTPLHANAYKLASGAEDLLERAEEIPTLTEAIAEMGWVVGMTSRGGKERNPLLSPEALAKELIHLSPKNSIGLVFGSEKDGLRNDELSLCHRYVRIPSSDAFPSLNLAQAVAVMCYELFKSFGRTLTPATQLAPAGQLESMLAHMEETLIQIGFLNRVHPKRMMSGLRRLFGRSELNEREVRILQGIWSQMDRVLRYKKEAMPSGQR